MKATVSLRAQNILDDRHRGRLLVNAIRDEINNRSKIIKPGDASYNDDRDINADPDHEYLVIDTKGNKEGVKKYVKNYKHK